MQSVTPSLPPPPLSLPHPLQRSHPLIASWQPSLLAGAARRLCWHISSCSFYFIHQLAGDGHRHCRNSNRSGTGWGLGEQGRGISLTDTVSPCALTDSLLCTGESITGGKGSIITTIIIIIIVIVVFLLITIDISIIMTIIIIVIVVVVVVVAAIFIIVVNL